MAALVPAIRVPDASIVGADKAWITGSSPLMTTIGGARVSTSPPEFGEPVSRGSNPALAEIRRFERTTDRLRVVYQEGGSERTVEAERVVNGAGRVANVDGLDLAAGKVQSERRRIALDAYLRSTSNPTVYVCGDAFAETVQLSPIATYEGRIVGRNIVDGAKYTPPDKASIPACVFTLPVLASVGLTQADAEEKRSSFELRSTTCAGGSRAAPTRRGRPGRRAPTLSDTLTRS